MWTAIFKERNWKGIKFLNGYEKKGVSSVSCPFNIH